VRQRHLFYHGTYVRYSMSSMFINMRASPLRAWQISQKPIEEIPAVDLSAGCPTVVDRRVELHVWTREVDSGAKLRQARASYLIRGSGERGG